MRLSGLLRYAVGNTFRRKGRALIAIFAVFIGAFTLTLTSGLGAGVSGYIESQVGALGSENVIVVTGSAPLSVLDHSRLERWDPSLIHADPGSSSRVLGDEDLAVIEDLPHVTEAIAAPDYSPQYIQIKGGERYRFVYGGYVPGKTVNLEGGRQLDYGSSTPEIIIPSFALEPLGFDSASGALSTSIITSFLGGDGVVQEIEATVVGVQQRALIGGNQPFVNSAFDERARAVTLGGRPSEEPAWYPYISVVSSDVDASVKAMADIGLAPTTTADTMGEYKVVIDGVLIAVNVLAAIAMIAAIIGIVNTLVMSIQERTRYIGLHRALGMPQGVVFASITIEAGLLGFVGAVLGAGAAIATGLTAGPRLVELAGLELPGLRLFSFSLSALGAILWGTAAVAVIAATLPARRAARLQPTDALRTEL